MTNSSGTLDSARTGALRAVGSRPERAAHTRQVTQPLPAAPEQPDPNRAAGLEPTPAPLWGDSALRQGSHSPVPTQTLCPH